MNAKAELGRLFGWYRDPWKRVAFGAVLVLIALSLGVRYNSSGSIPVGFWYETRIGSISRGDTIAFCPPTRIAAVGLARGYLRPSPACSAGVMPLAKVVVAVPGDTVRVSAAGITVDGSTIPNSAPRAFDPSNRPMPAIRRGAYEVQPGEVWVLGSDPASWDSRYYGPVPVRGVVGRLIPLALVGSTREQTARYESLVTSSRTV